MGVGAGRLSVHRDSLDHERPACPVRVRPAPCRRGRRARRRPGRHRGGDAAARPRPGRGRAPGPAGRRRPAGSATPGSPRRSAGRGHLQPQGLHPAHPPVPRPLPLLHVRDDAGAAARSRQGALPVARRGAGRRPGRCRDGLARKRCSPSATAPSSAGRSPRSGCTRTASTPRCRWATCARWRSGCSRRPGCSPTSTPASCRGRRSSGSSRSRSMGMMLETTATRLWSEPGGPHFGSPDKEPAVRLRVLEDAGRSAVPFTTGVLLGIGENYAERVDAIREIKASAQRHGHVQEVIVQNFRRSPDGDAGPRRPGARSTSPPSPSPCCSALGARQAPPNLSDSTELGLLLRAGVDDWGGVSPTPRPRQPRATVAEHRQAGAADVRGGIRAARAAGRAAAVRAPARAVARSRPHVSALAGPDGLAVEGRNPGRTALAGAGRRGRRRPRRPARRGGHGRAHVGPAQRLRRGLRRLVGAARAHRLRARRHSTALHGDREVLAALLHAEQDPAGLTDAEYLALLGADGTDSRRDSARRCRPRRRQR